MEQSCYLPPRPLDMTLPTSDRDDPGVFPQVVLGDPFTGLGGDSLRVALGKYNIHTHAVATAPGFWDTAVQPGDPVSVAPVAAQPVLAPDTQVQVWSPQRLELTQPALADAVGDLHTPHGVVVGCRFQRGSRFVERPGRRGLMHPHLVESANCVVLQWWDPRPDIGLRYGLSLGSHPRPLRLVRLRGYAASGAGTVELYSDDSRLRYGLGLEPRLHTLDVEGVLQAAEPLWLRLTSNSGLLGARVELQGYWVW